MNFNIYGIPFSGPDACGYADSPTPELCARWMGLSTWEAFARNHNGNGTGYQEPFAFVNHSYVLEASKKSLDLRYSLLKYFYSLFIAANGIGSVYRPLFFAFPYDEIAY